MADYIVNSFTNSGQTIKTAVPPSEEYVQGDPSKAYDTLVQLSLIHI